MTREQEFVERIVAKVAERAGQDVSDLEPPLYEAIDADALAAVVRSDAVQEVEFSYQDFMVHVDDQGEVRVTDPPSARPQRGQLG
jgi:type IV secretory pathway ATPase VirB11/archaellum biosynthesis ATPase